jgi:hypothetical protein
MADLGATLGKQIGPLPLGAWVAVVGGGLGIAWYANTKKGSSAEQPDQQLTETGVGEGTTAFIPAAEVSQPTAPLETLDDWINNAVKQAIALGATPLEIEQALRLYSKGEALSTRQATLVNRVIALIGPAPSGEITEVPVVTPEPTPVTPVTHKYAFVMSQAPTRYRNGRSVTFKGKLTDNGKGVGGRAIYVYRKHRAADRWRFYKLVPTYSTGVFGVAVSEPVRTASQYYVQLRFGGITRTFTLRQY